MGHYDELLGLAKEHSDHCERVQEVEPSIVESLANTDSQYPALEIGNREGGSSMLILAHIEKEGKHRELVTVDVQAQVPRVAEWAKMLGIPTRHVQESQEGFILNNKQVFGFVYLDADHNEHSVTRDIGVLIPYLAKGCIVAVDDTESWDVLPEFPELERVDYHVNEGEGERHWKSGHHFIAYRRR